MATGLKPPRGRLRCVNDLSLRFEVGDRRSDVLLDGSLTDTVFSAQRALGLPSKPSAEDRDFVAHPGDLTGLLPHRLSDAEMLTSGIEVLAQPSRANPVFGSKRILSLPRLPPAEHDDLVVRIVDTRHGTPVPSGGLGEVEGLTFCFEMCSSLSAVMTDTLLGDSILGSEVGLLLPGKPPTQDCDLVVHSGEPRRVPVANGIEAVLAMGTPCEVLQPVVRADVVEVPNDRMSFRVRKEGGRQQTVDVDAGLLSRWNGGQGYPGVQTTPCESGLQGLFAFARPDLTFPIDEVSGSDPIVLDRNEACGDFKMFHGSPHGCRDFVNESRLDVIHFNIKTQAERRTR